MCWFEACLTTALDGKGLLIYHVAETGKNCTWNDRGRLLIITAYVITSGDKYDVFYTLFLRDFHAFSFGELVNYHFSHYFAAEIKKKKIEKQATNPPQHIKPPFPSSARQVEIQACPVMLQEELCSLVTAVSRI